MHVKALLVLVFWAHCAAAQSQPQPQQPAPAPDAAKKEQVARVLKLQQPGIESMARALAEQPAAQLATQAAQLLPARVPPERREAVAREIEADIRKFVAATEPQVRERALRIAPATIGPLLESRFTEDELRQIATIMESPVFAKYQRLGGEMQRALGDRLATELRPTLEPRVRALEQSIGRRLGLAAPAASGAASGAAPAR